ncbi:thiamine phosphate synthase [Marinomonas sp. IMCC 4694]|uniref:thiamine phosphate synthase n=1 Tax=Marinomonas sp. IMCC 4694 TaxID=2605432 RepID=UPI0011E7761B|nr:thiamine phosphate synthase [Marinomonas sp. IMCC 4694]TYL49440.1 thiamine phosphate synthase [Marinomonas sp. IMCC 4694]
MTKRPPVVWCVGGSDSSAHAGLQADLRTGQDVGCHVQTIVTCMTAQNSKIVQSVEPVSLAMFHAQWQTLLDDVSPDAIKVSLLPSLEIVQACSMWLQRIRAEYPLVSVVFDPVMAASSASGNRLQPQTVGAALLENILPWVDVITPNAMEFTALTGLSSDQAIATIHRKLLENVPLNECLHAAWLLKGGHSSSDQATDWLMTQKMALGFSTPKLQVHNTRGTGCTLSTALASFLAHGYDLVDALTMAKAYVTGALKCGVQIGEGAGPLGRPGWPRQNEHLPTVVSAKGESLAINGPFAAVDCQKMGLYPVVDSVEWLSLVLSQGVKIAQLRIKDPQDKDLIHKIEQAIRLGQQFDAQVFINDYWQLAIQLGAYGVHLGQEDLDVADLKQIQAAGLRLGISTHGYYEIARAQAIQPSYIALGHIFPTQTKNMPSQPQGLTRLAHYAALLEGVFPTVAIGGISAERLSAVAQTGVSSVAVVTAITKANKPEQTTRALMGLFEQAAKRFTVQNAGNKS